MKKAFDIATQLPVMESFYTLQGEGFHTGKAAYFIRLAGCDVGCVWCDVKESWEIHENQIQSIDSIVETVVTNKANFVVLTGGEPAMYDLTHLVAKLKNQNMYISIETSGVYPLVGSIDWYTFSPKKFKKPCEEAYKKANELKVVIYHKSDLEWAIEHQKKVHNDCLLYLQPEWSRKEQITPLIVDFIKSNPEWRLSLQTHKYIHIP
jgi:7-carboxy-7-deazaguanine synthase